MSKNEYTSFDKLIKKSVQEKAKKDLAIDVDKAWEKFNEKYPTTKKKPTHKIWAIACSMLILIGSAMFILPTNATAFSAKFFDSVKTFLTGKVQSEQISFTDNKIIEDMENFIPQEVYHALKEVPYNVLLPVDLIGIYSIGELMVHPIGSSTEVIMFLESQKHGRIILQQVNITGHFNKGISYDTEDAIVEPANVRGQDAKLEIYKDGSYCLSWIDKDVFISMSGNLPKSEIFMIANSMRRIN